MQEVRNYDDCRCAQSITTDFLVENNLELQSKNLEKQMDRQHPTNLLSYSTIVP